MPSLLEQAMRRKPVRDMNVETGADTGKSELKRSVGLWRLAAIGIGGTAGTGIFFILSESVPLAGPAVIWSFVLAAVAAGLTAVCYAELAGAMPVSGSSYSYAYATLGELIAVGVGACLVLEWGVAGAATAVGWSHYVNKFLSNVFGFELPATLASAPEQGGICNLPAMLLILMCALLLIRGVSESTTANAVMVAIKLAVLVMFIVIGLRDFTMENLQPFAPYGVSGVTIATSVIFFTFVGLDGVATAGEEAKNPHRNVPLAILIAVVTVTVMYVLVALVAVGAQPWDEFRGQQAGLAQILENATGAPWLGTVFAAGAIISIFSVTLICVYGQTRVLFAMARDGIVPPTFHKVNLRTLTPVPNTVIVAVGMGLLAGFIPIHFLAEMTSVGTLAAFVSVAIGVILLRRRAPQLARSFKVPLYPITPILAIAGSLWIISSLRAATLYVFAIWVAAALIWYLVYARSHSHLGRHEHVGLDAEGLQQ